MAKLKYYAAAKDKLPAETVTKAEHSEFLRTGRISRRRDDWLTEERRYLTYEEVAKRTGQKLMAAGETTHQRINSFHRAIQFPKMIFHHTFEESPHLGYCHVTASRTTFAQYADVTWAFYIANFFCEMGGGEQFFEEIRPQYSRMYFAVAMQADKSAKAMKIDRSIRENGLLFRTHDPRQAFKNLLMLNAGNARMRQAIATL
ncbi:MAG: DUF6656 family protein [Allorhizobium sp.]